MFPSLLRWEILAPVTIRENFLMQTTTGGNKCPQSEPCDLYLVRTPWLSSLTGAEFLTGWHAFPRPKFLSGVFLGFVGIFVFFYIAVPPGALLFILPRLYLSDLYSYGHHNSSGLFFWTKLIIVRLSWSWTQRLYFTNKHNFEELMFKKNCYLLLTGRFWILHPCWDWFPVHA